MKLLMKQRVFSWTDTYDVYDEAGNKKYFVKAELFRLGHQIHVFDVSGNEIGMIKQRLFTLLPSFDIVIGGREFGNIQKEFTFFKPRYEIDYNGWRCEGDFLAWDYDVYADSIMDFNAGVQYFGCFFVAVYYKERSTGKTDL